MIRSHSIYRRAAFLSILYPVNFSKGVVENARSTYGCQDPMQVQFAFRSGGRSPSVSWLRQVVELLDRLGTQCHRKERLESDYISWNIFLVLLSLLLAIHFLWQQHVSFLIQKPVFLLSPFYWNVPSLTSALSSKFLKDSTWHQHDFLFKTAYSLWFKVFKMMCLREVGWAGHFHFSLMQYCHKNGFASSDLLKFMIFKTVLQLV